MQVSLQEGIKLSRLRQPAGAQTHLYKQWPLLALCGHGLLSVPTPLCTLTGSFCFLTVAESRFLPALITSSSVHKWTLICPPLWPRIHETCALSKHFLGSGFVYCWLQQFSGSVWSTDVPQGVIQSNHVAVLVGGRRIYHGLLRRRNYTGGRQPCVFQKGSAGCQCLDLKT